MHCWQGLGTHDEGKKRVGCMAALAISRPAISRWASRYTTKPLNPVIPAMPVKQPASSEMKILLQQGGLWAGDGGASRSGEAAAAAGGAVACCF